MDITLNALKRADLPYLDPFPPKSWGFSLAAFAAQNFSNPAVRFITAKQNGKLVGIGNIIINGTWGWIGNMIVIKSYQRRGIGTRLFRQLIRIGEQHEVKKFALIASDEGYPLYLKEGFTAVGYYNFYSKPESVPGATPPVMPIPRLEMPAVWALDKEITGEDRNLFLSQYATRVWGIKSNGKLEGIYYPGYGTGCVIARNDTAGMELLRFRLQHTELTTVIPERNRTATHFMETLGCSLTMRFMRMERPALPCWNPRLIFSRGTGYAG